MLTVQFIDFVSVIASLYVSRITRNKYRLENLLQVAVLVYANPVILLSLGE